MITLEWLVENVIGEVALTLLILKIYLSALGLSCGLQHLQLWHENSKLQDRVP